MKSKLEGIANCLQLVDCTLDGAKQNEDKTGRHSSKRKPIRPTGIPPNQELRWEVRFTDGSGRSTIIIIGKTRDRMMLIAI